MKSFSVMTESVPKNIPRFLFRRIISLLITFYISYLFVHFFLLDELKLDKTLVIVLKVWTGHIFLNISTLRVMKHTTFGDLLVNIEYRSFRGNIGQVRLVLLRSILAVTLLHLVLVFNYLAGFTLYSFIISLLFAISLNWDKVTINDTRLSIIDWITGTVAIKSHRKVARFTLETKRGSNK